MSTRCILPLEQPGRAILAAPVETGGSKQSKENQEFVSRIYLTFDWSDNVAT